MTDVLDKVRRRCDRGLSLLLLAHVPFALGLAALHGMWIPAIAVSLLAGVAPAYLASRRPGATSTRFVIAISLMAFSALFIQETHGLIEMHFHVFASLAFLVVYRDWRVPVAAAACIAVHHAVFHALQMQGVPVWVMPGHHGSFGMVGVHALFVVFETAVLVFVARMLEREALYMAELRQNDATERDRLLHLAQALERRDLTARVDDAGDGATVALQDGIGQVAALVRSIQGTVEVVSHASREVTDASRQSERVSEEIAHAIAELAGGAERQAQILRDARAAAETVADGMHGNAERAGDAADAVEQTRAVAEAGVVDANAAAAAMTAVEAASGAMAEAIEELDRQVGADRHLRDHHLEDRRPDQPARAERRHRGRPRRRARPRLLGRRRGGPQAGRRGVRRRGQHLGPGREIRAVADRTVTVVDDGARRTAEGAATVGNARDAFTRIGEAVGGVADHVREIATEARKMAAEAGMLRTRMDELASLNESSTASTEEVSATTQETSASAQELAGFANRLDEAAGALQGLVVQFAVSPEGQDAAAAISPAGTAPSRSTAHSPASS